jgi:glycosyltransferase involved in cell wall biosynthesis
MAFGLPIIATDVVGCIDDLLAPEGNAIVVPRREYAAFAEAMERIAADAELRVTMGRESARMIARWTLANEAQNVCSAWREVLQQ